VYCCGGAHVITLQELWHVYITMGNLHTRTWSFHSGGGVAHTVLLRHHVATGQRELIIDTVPAATGNVTSNAMDNGHTWRETVDGKLLVVKIASNFWGGFYYRATVDGIRMQPSAAKGGEGGVDFSIAVVPTPDLREGKHPVFRLSLSRPEREDVVSLHTFEDFQALDSNVRSAYRDMHRTKELPHSPPTAGWLARGTTSDAFVAERASKLAIYIEALAHVEGISNSQDFLTFVGIDPAAWFQQQYEDAHRAVMC